MRPFLVILFCLFLLPSPTQAYPVFTGIENGVHAAGLTQHQPKKKKKKRKKKRKSKKKSKHKKNSNNKKKKRKKRKKKKSQKPRLIPGKKYTDKTRGIL